MGKRAESPFKGMRRRRLPAIHLMTALEGGVPLREALAGFFFVVLHDRFRHPCLVSAAETSVGDGDASHGKEWSFLEDDDAFPFFIIADAAIEQVQWWLAHGVEPPRGFKLLNTTLVTVPPRVAAYFKRQAPSRRDSRRYVAELRRQVKE